MRTGTGAGVTGTEAARINNTARESNDRIASMWRNQTGWGVGRSKWGRFTEGKRLGRLPLGGHLSWVGSGVFGPIFGRFPRIFPYTAHAAHAGLVTPGGYRV